MTRIRDVRAYVVGAQGGSDYHDQTDEHWIVGKIACPMSVYPEYRATRQSWGIGVLGSVVVEVEDEQGTVGVGVSMGGEPACYFIERHFARFLKGREPADCEIMWDQMFRSSLHYGRRGLGLTAISAVDLAVWDLLGRQRQEPVYALLGGAVHDEIRFYATTPRPDLAKDLGFIGGKIPLPAAPAEGEEGMRENLTLAETMRERVGDDFFLSWDCYMALDVPSTLELIDRMAPYRFKWFEEFLMPDDYWGYAEVKARRPADTMVTTGEHEATRWGFKLLLDMECADILQPDVGWVGGLTELVKIADMAEARGVPIVPHGSSVYSYHFVVTRRPTEFAEFLMMAPKADVVTPMFAPLLEGEPVPADGRLRVPDTPGFGVELNRSLPLVRPYPAS